MNGDDDTPAANVEQYISRKPAFAQPICEKLREVILKAGPKLDEGIRWGGPSYKGKGLVLGMGAFKEHVTLFFNRGQELEDPEGLMEPAEGTANSRSVKVRTLAEVTTKAKAIAALIKQAVELDGKGAPAKKVKREDIPLPTVLSAALKKHPLAKKNFEALPPSARREYSEWIATAKREETVQKRLEKAIALLEEGKHMYEANR